MKLFIIGSVVLFLIVLIEMKWIHRVRVIKKITAMTEAQKVEDLNHTLQPYGFVFNPGQDIMQSRMYAWQRKIGYCELYDQKAPWLKMVFDCEPIRFSYDNRRWLLELWKGQYGIMTGAEIGLYVTGKEDYSIPQLFEGPYYDSVSDEDRIQMYFELERDGDCMFFRSDNHWWLTGFEIGSYVWPSQLQMKVRLSFPNEAMRNAFLDGLRQAGYKKKDIHVFDRNVSFMFHRAKTRQPAYSRWKIHWIQGKNHMNQWLFQYETRNFINTLDKVLFLKYACPRLFRILILQFYNPTWMEFFTRLLK